MKPEKLARPDTFQAGMARGQVVTLPTMPKRPSPAQDAGVHESPTSHHEDSFLDAQLVQRVQQGDKRAFDLLVVRYQSRVAALISRFVRDRQDVLDLTQEAFVKAYRALDHFRGDSAFYTWLYRIAVNTAKNFLDASSRRPQAVMDVDDAAVIDQGVALRENASPDKFLQRDQIKRLLDKAIAELPEELRGAFLLREFEGLSYEDIAAVLDCPIGTVRSRIFRARDAIDRKLAPMLEH